jgi:DeoR family transcriptional regulator of aga operon
MAESTEARNALTEREQRILEVLSRSGGVTVPGLCEALSISPATARRDLQTLETKGRLRRTHGGAIPIEPLLYEGFRHDSTFKEQIGRHAEEKRRIAIAAAELISEAETIAFTSGTTTTLVTRNIPHLSGLTVVTNTVNMAMELSNRADITVVVTGGVLRSGWFSLVGPHAVESMHQFFPDKVFVGVNGIDPERGVTTFNPEEMAVDRMMIRQAKQKIVVADHSKLRVVATCLVCPIEDIDILITDTGADDATVASFEAAGVSVRRV